MALQDLQLTDKRYIEIQYQEKTATNIINTSCTLKEMLDWVKYGYPPTNSLIDKAREAGKGSKEYENIKKALPPAFLLNFRFDKILNADSIIESTGLLYLDIDKFDVVNTLEKVKSEICTFPFVVACWKSLSKKGLSIIAAVECMTKDNYSGFTNYISDKYGSENGVEFDINAFKTTQKVVLSRDSEIFINYIAKPISFVDVEQYQKFNEIYIKEKLDGIPQINDEVQTKSYKVSSTVLLNTKEHIGEYNTPSLIEKPGFSSFKFSDKDKYLNQDELYAVFPKGVEVIETYIPNNTIYEGKRAKTAFTIAMKLYHLNHCSANILYNFLKYLRSVKFENPNTFRDAELYTIAKAVIKKYNPAKIISKTKKIIFNTRSGLTPKAKQSEAARVMGKMKCNATAKLFTDNYKPGMTQTRLLEITGMSESTIKNYWYRDKDDNVQFSKEGRIAAKTQRINLKANQSKLTNQCLFKLPFASSATEIIPVAVYTECSIAITEITSVFNGLKEFEMTYPAIRDKGYCMAAYPIVNTKAA
jgi:hypothetical protein